MGRLSTFAKNRILNLRFQKSCRIKQIATTLMQEDQIKVSRKSISTFLKKYLETKSIQDKPRSGRNKKLTQEEIKLIGELTRLNRDITAPKIKEYLNLNVSTYTILRASKLFEWNKLNPNSNEAKKAAALERQLNGECSKHNRHGHHHHNNNSNNKNKRLTALNKITNHHQPRKNGGEGENEEEENSGCGGGGGGGSNNNNNNKNNNMTTNDVDGGVDDSFNLNLISESEISTAKTVSSSPMVFATKILYKIFDMSELIGHNVSGKTFNKYIKGKKALDEKRINYIRWLVEHHYESAESTTTMNREELWKACRTAINKSIRNNEIKNSINTDHLTTTTNTTTTAASTMNHQHLKKMFLIKTNAADDENENENGSSSASSFCFKPTETNLRVFQIADVNLDSVPSLEMVTNNAATEETSASETNNNKTDHLLPATTNNHYNNEDDEAIMNRNLDAVLKLETDLIIDSNNNNNNNSNSTAFSSSLLPSPPTLRTLRNRKVKSTNNNNNHASNYDDVLSPPPAKSLRSRNKIIANK